VISSAILLVTPNANAVQPSAKWDEARYTHTEGPFRVDFALDGYAKPSQIAFGEQVTLGVDTWKRSGEEACTAEFTATVLRDGVPITAPKRVAVDQFDFTNVPFPAEGPGRYTMTIQGTRTSDDVFDDNWCETPIPYSTTAQLFTLKKSGAGKSDKTRVKVKSSGGRWITASTRGKSPTLPISFTVKSKKSQDDLLYTICLHDGEYEFHGVGTNLYDENYTSDCYFKLSKMRPTSTLTKTASGWQKKWGLWWERTKPSTCISYYLNEPKAHVMMYVTSTDGQILGRKKHSVKISCRV